nr:immunoglobulin light chain junction region [Macaca mulatta]
CQQGYGFPLTF